MLTIGAVHSTNRRVSSINVMSNGIHDNYNFVVSDRVNMKKERDGSIAQFFTVYARANNDKNYPKVERTYRDFKSLEVALSNNLRVHDIECPQLERDSIILDLSSQKTGGDYDLPLTDKLSNIKRFLKEISADPALHIEPFYDFFKIPKPETHFEPRVSDVDFSDKLRATIKPETTYSESGVWADYEKQSTVDYCSYFKVVVMGAPVEREDRVEGGKTSHHYYCFMIKPLSDPETTLSIEKRYSEFLDLSVQMKTTISSRPPPLPAKLMLKDKHGLQKRGEGLEEWLMIVLNEKIFFCPELFSFIGMDGGSVVRFSNFDTVGALMELIQFKLSITEKKSATNSDESFVLYEIKVLCLNAVTKDKVESYKVFRRFKEFDHLHNELKHKFQKYTKPLPELPGKMSYLNILSKDRDHRKDKLDMYLRSLCEYPNVFQTISFRKFIDLDARKLDGFLSLSHSGLR